MPEKAPRKRSTRKRTETLAQQLEAILVRIPVNMETLTAALLLTQQIIELARVVKVPLQVEKVATMETFETVAPSPIEQVAPETKSTTQTEAVKDGEK